MMGRRSAPKAPPPAFENGGDGRDVPPSTISALVEQHSRTRTTDETFAQILQEIRSDPQGNIPKSEEENCSLIRTLVRTCLATLDNVNPLVVGGASTVDHAVACLEVVQMTIRRTPKVLLHPMSLDQSNDAELCLWMFPRLFSAAKVTQDEVLQDSIRTLLASALNALSSDVRHSKTYNKIRIFYQICVEDLSFALDPGNMSKNSRRDFSLTLPSAEAREVITGIPQQPIVVDNDLQVTFGNPLEAFQITLYLLDALTSSSSLPRTTELSMDVVFHGWLIPMLVQLWHSLDFSRVLFPAGEKKHTSYLFLEVLFRVCTDEGPCLPNVLRRKLDWLLLTCTERSLSVELRNLHEPYQALLIDLFRAAEKSVRKDCEMRQVAHERLHLLIETVLKDGGLESSSVLQITLTGLLGATSGENAADAADSRARRNSTTDANPRALKKLRLDGSRHASSTATLPHKLLDDMCSPLGEWSRRDLSGLANALPGLFSDLSHEQQVRVLKTLSRLPCAWISGVKPTSSYATHQVPQNPQGHTWDEQYWKWFHEIVCALISMPTPHNSREQRVLLGCVIKSLSKHTAIVEHLDLTTSKMGLWCIKNLHSSVRQLRLSAALTLPNFLDERVGPSLCRKNRVELLEHLRQLVTSDDPRLCEALIVAFGRIAHVCGEDERPIALNQLVEYLGHTSKSVSDMAYLELRHVAYLTGSSTCEELFRPFWKIIGVTVVKDILTRPQKVQQLSDLLGLSVNQFLILTQADVLPWLVLEKRQDILQRLARARGKDTTVWDLCMSRRNLAAILSLIIVQHPSDITAAISSCLSHASIDFAKEEATNLLRADPIAVACEVLKMVGDSEGVEQEQAMRGFHELTVHIEKRDKQAKAASTQARYSALFFQNHALGIMNIFSDVIENQQDSATNKKRCLRALQQMIRAGADSIVVALPQIRASLQSAMNTKELRDPAFIAWAALLDVLKADEDLEGLIDQTFAAIVQNWDSFSTGVQQQAYETVASLIKTHAPLIQSSILTIPSLANIPLLSKFETQLAKFRDKEDVSTRLQAFSRRCRDENATVVLQAVRELIPFLDANQQWLHASATTEQPNPAIPSLVRSLLDTCVRFNEDSSEILELSAQSLGIIGCLDPNRVDTVQDKQEMIALSNFDQEIEAVNFVAYLLENVLVKAFHSVSNPRAQGFLAYVMQELLKFSGFSREAAATYHPHGSQADEMHQRWLRISERARNTLTPFLNSHYVLTTHPSKLNDFQQYPIFTSEISHGTWLRTFVYDLLLRSSGDNAKQIFHVVSRVIRGYDVSIAAAVLPFATANVILGGTDAECKDVYKEMLIVLEHNISQGSQAHSDALKLCSESVFQVLDYLSKFLQEKKKGLAAARSVAARSARPMAEMEEQTYLSQISLVEHVLSKIPPQVISRRAVECGSYARALFHWEQHMRTMRERPNSRKFADDKEGLYQRLQDIYSQIDEPDGIEGISTYIHVLKPEQQVLEHRRAGRWAAAQSWYELRLKDQPDDLDLHVDLLQCLKHAGQHQLILDHTSNMHDTLQTNGKVLSLVTEAAWSTGNWKELERSLVANGDVHLSDFNTGLGSAMLALREKENEDFAEVVRRMRTMVAKTLSRSTTISLQTCHDQILKLHALYELEAISGLSGVQRKPQALTPILDQRLDVLGSYIPDKQHLLGIKRAVMHLSPMDFADQDVASTWLASARLARKENWTNIAYEAVLQASQLGDESAKIEQARLLWKDGEHRKAIRSLEGAIEANAFKARSESHMSTRTSLSAATATGLKDNEQNLIVAKAHLLLAKWLDSAGQTQSSEINVRYQTASRSFTRWEKGLYHLGRFYNKLLESQKAMPTSKQDHKYLSGETAKLVIENYLRSLMFGCKYLFESMPKLLTLWLDFGLEANRSISREVPEDVRTKATTSRPGMMDTMNKQVKKYSEKLPAYLFYTALPQMITRMGHQNKQVYELLASVIIKVVAAHPQQGLWPLLAVVKSTAPDRAGRANNILSKLMEKNKNTRSDVQGLDLRSLVVQGQKMSSQLLHACETKLDGRASVMSLSRDLGFNTKVAPCPLVVPLEQTLSASLPNTTMDHGIIKQHRAFPAAREAITISSFADEVLVLASLQRPRKLTVRGSDGNKYGLLCKPNDDLRKDQRLMEFNTMINRALKKDAESSKRRLYIRTYAVTPLNEACGLIEWVDGLKPMRDILLNSYRAQGTKVDYNLLRDLLNEACSTADGYRIFSEQIVPMYRPVLHEWFTEFFPDPESWFAARLRYTRSAAVASMQGYALGLGDRHGENVLLEGSSGGVFHVDFNCLFEKGLTFDKPELVPFRLTHNMVDAFGAYGVEGPFRRSAECAMKVMRANEDALLTILETFVYDPTADFVGARKRPVKGVPETPKEVLESVRSKVRGLMRGESVPLSVGGHVDALIRQATDPRNLCAMYIGWCAFL